MLKVYCKNTGTSVEFPEGTTLLEMLPAFKFDKPYDIVSAKVNNVSQGLKFRIFNNRDVEFLDYRSYAGRNVYCRSLNFLLCKAVYDILEGSKVNLIRPISKGCYCAVEKADGSALAEEEVGKIRIRMQELVAAATPFRRYEERTEDAIRVFEQAGASDKVKLLMTTDLNYVTYHTLEGTPDFFYDALVPDCSFLKVWEIKYYKGGIFLRVPDRHNPENLAPFVEQEKTFEVFAENRNWNRIMGLSNAGDMNQACIDGHAAELIQVAEALQEKKIVQIAEEIEKRYNESGVRIVLITGPSSSGKSTVCKRLSIQLLACGLRPVSFSTDDYFVNRVETPLLPDGKYDFDNFETVDHKALQKDVVDLIAGKEVKIPEYNFTTGIREYNGKTLKITPGTVLIIEGIHALNPELLPEIDDAIKFKIFINTITSISLDDHNCIPTSDNRLLRRIIRDFRKGAFSPQETIANWPNVRRAEVQWIYPYQESADVLFNSSYLVEFAVLRCRAEQVLATVPRNCNEYGEAARLLRFLQYFVRVSEKEVPPTSLLRSFIGGGQFN